MWVHFVLPRLIKFLIFNCTQIIIYWYYLNGNNKLLKKRKKPDNFPYRYNFNAL